MNLRSVFTAEQQRILERYYENGMTNQSKACFQLILQCAQETKLDFSVVRVKSLFVCDETTVSDLPNIWSNYYPKFAKQFPLVTVFDLKKKISLGIVWF